MSPSIQRQLGWFAIACVGYHALAMVSLHVLVPEVSPLSDMVGDYLSSPSQLLSRTTFLALAGALASLAFGLRPALPSGLRSSVATGLIVVAIPAFVGVAMLPGSANQIARVAQPAMVLTIIMFSLVLRGEPPWRSVGAWLLVIPALLVFLFVITIATGYLISIGLGGLANRLVLVLIYTWVVLVARGIIISLRRSS